MRHAVNAGPPSENQQNSKKPHLVKKNNKPTMHHYKQIAAAKQCYPSMG